MELYQQEPKSDYVPLLDVFVVSADRSVYKLSLMNVQSPTSMSRTVPHQMTLSEIVAKKGLPRHVRTWDLDYRAQLEIQSAVMDASGRLFIVTHVRADEMPRHKVFYAGDEIVELGTTVNPNLILFPSGEVRCVCGYEGRRYFTPPLTDKKSSFQRDTPYLRTLRFCGTDADNLVRIYTNGDTFRMEGVVLAPDTTFYIWGEAVPGAFSTEQSAISPYWASITSRYPVTLNLYRRVAAAETSARAVAGPASAGDLGSVSSPAPAPGPTDIEPRSKMADTVLALSVMSEPTPEFAAIVASLRAELAAAETRARQLEQENAAQKTALASAQKRIHRLENDAATQNICPVCIERKVGLFLDPCGHTLCSDPDCFRMTKGLCPVCRVPIADTRKLFLP